MSSKWRTDYYKILELLTVMEDSHCRAVEALRRIANVLEHPHDHAYDEIAGIVEKWKEECEE